MPKNEKKSLRPLPLSMRGKKRYLAVRFSSASPLRERDVDKAIWETFLPRHGELLVAKQKIWLAHFDAAKNLAIVRCALEHFEDVKAGLLAVKAVAGKPVSPEIVGVSGSIKKLKTRRH